MSPLPASSGAPTPRRGSPSARGGCFAGLVLPQPRAAPGRSSLRARRRDPAGAPGAAGVPRVTWRGGHVPGLVTCGAHAGGA